MMQTNKKNETNSIYQQQLRKICIQDWKVNLLKHFSEEDVRSSQMIGMLEWFLVYCQHCLESGLY